MLWAKASLIWFSFGFCITASVILRSICNICSLEPKQNCTLCSHVLSIVLVNSHVPNPLLILQWAWLIMGSHLRLHRSCAKQHEFVVDNKNPFLRGAVRNGNTSQNPRVKPHNDVDSAEPASSRIHSEASHQGNWPRKVCSWESQSVPYPIVLP